MAFWSSARDHLKPTAQKKSNNINRLAISSNDVEQRLSTRVHYSHRILTRNFSISSPEFLIASFEVFDLASSGNCASRLSSYSSLAIWRWFREIACMTDKSPSSFRALKSAPLCIRSFTDSRDRCKPATCSDVSSFMSMALASAPALNSTPTN